MIVELTLEVKEIAALEALDFKLAQAVRAEGCPRCGGRLHRADFPRKPRGGRLWAAGEAWVKRFGLCCGRRGCRRRRLPPSLRFLGRRVYLLVAVVLASGCAHVAAVSEAAKVTGVPRRTLRRWLGFWQSEFPRTAAWASLRARFAPPPPAEKELPLSLVDRVAGDLGETGAKVLRRVAQLLAPITTRIADCARFLRVALAEPEGATFTQ